MRRIACALRQRTLAFLLTLFVAVCNAPLALAAPRKTNEPPKEPAYALEYGVVIFLVLLALAVVFRPGRRTELVDEIKLPFGPKR